MTTEPRRRPSPPPDPARGWKLALTSALAGAYLLAWWGLGGLAARRPEPEPEQAQAGPQARAVWLDQLPARERPAVALPPGWRLASGERPGPVRLVRSGSSRSARIRTRSS